MPDMSTENFFSRRQFIFASTLFVMPALFIRGLRTLISIRNEGCTIKIPASSMKVRAHFVRDDFVSYLQKGADYPFAKIFHVGGMLPSDEVKARQLLQRESHLRITKTAGATFLTNKGTRALDAPFKAEIKGQAVHLTVNFPATITLNVAYDASNLTVEATTPLLLTLSDIPDIACEALFPSQHLLKRLSVAPESMMLETASVDGSNKYTLLFDFTSPLNAQPPRIEES
jgi:hypothetical protein